MVQNRVIKRLLGQGSIDHSADPNSSYDARPSPSFVARPAFNQEASFSLGSPLTCVDISPDGTHAVVAGDKIFKTLEINGDKITEQYDLRAAIRNPGDTSSSSSSTIEPSRIGHIRWSHGEIATTIIAAATTGRIATYDLNRLNGGFEVGRITENKRQVHKLAINPLRGNLLLTAGQDGTVRFFDIKVPPNRPTATFIRRALYPGNNEAVRDVKWSPIRGFEFACSTANGTVMHWDTRNTRAPLLKINAHDGACLSISWHPDGEHIVSAGLDHQCYVWSLGEGANKRQKPKYSFSTPAPVSIVSWRPPSWSGSAQALRASQVVTVYNDENSLKTQNSTVNVWDLARPGLPFKEITHHETSPTGMQWQNTDILWTVSREGVFRQNDLAYAPKVIDRVPLSEFAISPAGEVLILLEERHQKQQRHPPPPPLTPHEKPVLPRSRLSMTAPSPSGTQLGMSRSDSEEDTGGSFLGPKMGLKMKKKSPSRTRTTPQPDLEVMKLEGALRAGGQFTPGQTMGLGPLPGPMGREMFKFLSESYLMAITDDLRESELGGEDKTAIHVRLQRILHKFAEGSKAVGQYRMAQSFEQLAFVMGTMLQRRAEYHRQQRLHRVAERKREHKERERKHSRDSQRLEHLHFLHDRTPTKKDKPRSIQEKKSGNVKGTTIAKTLLHEEESTSTMTTPLARPATDSPQSTTQTQTRQPLLRLESDDFKLPPSSLHSQTHPSALISTTNLQPPIPSEETVTPKPSSPTRSPRRSPLRKPSRDPTHQAHDSLEGGYDFYDLDALHNSGPSTPAIDISSPMVKKAPLKLDMPAPVFQEIPDRPNRVERHDSNESFAMFSTSGTDSPYRENPPGSLPRSTPKHHARFCEIGGVHDELGEAQKDSNLHHTFPQKIENQRWGEQRGDTESKSTEGDRGDMTAFGMQSTGLQSSDFDSSWDSGGHESRMRSLGAGWDSMGSDADEVSTSSQRRHHNPYFGEHAKELVQPRSVAEVEDTGDRNHHDDDELKAEGKFSTHFHAINEEDHDDGIDRTSFQPTGTQTPIDEQEESQEILDKDYLPHPEDPQFITPALDPHILIPRLIAFLAQTSSLFASFLILALSPHLHHSVLSPDRDAAILGTYHRRLESQKLFVLATLIRKLSYPTYTRVFSQGRAAMTGEVVYWCDTEGCERRLKKAGLRVGESVKRCERCREALEGCAVCGGHEYPTLAGSDEEEGPLGAQRIWVTCQGCGHGGHEVCLMAWHSTSASSVSAEPESGAFNLGKLSPNQKIDGQSFCGDHIGGNWSTEMNISVPDSSSFVDDNTENSPTTQILDGQSTGGDNTVKLEFEPGDSSEEPEGICPLPGCLHPCLPGPWRRQHMSKIEAAKAAKLSKSVRSELDARSSIPGGRSGRASRRNSGDGSKVKMDNDEAAQSKAVDALRFGERDLYRERKEAERARDREKERRKSVMVLTPEEEERVRKRQGRV